MKFMFVCHGFDALDSEVEVTIVGVVGWTGVRDVTDVLEEAWFGSEVTSHLVTRHIHICWILEVCESPPRFFAVVDMSLPLAVIYLATS